VQTARWWASRMELERARGDDRTRPPTRGGDPRASHRHTVDRTRVRHSRAAPTLAWNQEFLTRPIATPHERVTLLRRLGIPADDSSPGARSSPRDAPRLYSRSLPGRASRCFLSPFSRATEAPSSRAELRTSPQKGSALDPDAVHHPSALDDRRGDQVPTKQMTSTARDHHERYRVRWDQKHESILYPADGVVIIPRRRHARDATR
jgi:hypothetical protein